MIRSVMLRMALLTASIGFATSANAADDADARIRALEERIRVLERLVQQQQAAAQPSAPVAQNPVPDTDSRLRALERKFELKQEEDLAKVPTTPVVSASEKGLNFASKDGAFSIKFHSLVQTDARVFEDADTLPAGSNTVLFRRVRPSIDGTLFGWIDYRVNPDFAGNKIVLQDAYADLRFSPKAKLRVGKFKAPFGIERLQGAADIRFIERGLPTALSPNRDLGVQLFGDLASGRVNYAIAAGNGVLDGGSSEAFNDVDGDNGKDITLRVFTQPFFNSESFALRNLGFGVAYSHGNQDGISTRTALPAYRTPGQQQFFAYRAGTDPTLADGERTRWSPQLTYYYNQFGVLAEYIRSEQDVRRGTGASLRRDTLDQNAWQVEGTWLITGEEQSYKDVKPRAPFVLGGPGWGAVELAARVGELNVDDDAFIGGTASFADPASSAQSARATGIGVNWYLNRVLKLSFDYERTRFDGGALANADRPDEKVWLSRVQVSF